MIKLERPICILDIETTGVDVEKDRIVEIAILKFYPSTERSKKVVRVNPGIPIPKETTEIHGISDLDVKNCPNFDGVAAEIHGFIYKCDIAGYNCNSFDIVILYNEFSRAGFDWDYSGINFVDVMNIAKRKEPRDLSWALRFYCGREHEDAHGAGADVDATFEVLMAQMKRYDDIGDDIESLAKYSNFDKGMADISGKFAYDQDGDLVFTFGKHRDEKAKNHLDYLRWMGSSNFPNDTKRIVQKILTGK